MNATSHDQSPAAWLIRFTLPILMGRFVQVLYGYIDMLVVGRALGTTALAGVGSTMNAIHLATGFCMGMANSVSIHIAQRFGHHDDNGMKRCFGTGSLLCLGMGLLLALIATPLVGAILTCLQTPADIWQDANCYLTWILCALPITIFNILLPGVLQAVGDSKSPVYFQLIATAVNIILDVSFVLLLHWGVMGVALATVLSQGIVIVLCLCKIRKKYRQFRIARADYRLHRDEAVQMLRLGIPMGVQVGVIELGNLLVQYVINGLGTTAVAAVTAGQRIRGIYMLPLFSLGTATATYVAQNFGAGQMERLRKGVKTACGIAISVGVIMALLDLALGNFFIDLLLPYAPDAATMAASFLRWNSSFLFLLGFMLVLRNALQGMGFTRSSTVASIAELTAGVLCALWLIPATGFTGVCLTNPLAWVLSSIPLMVAYVHWRTHAKMDAACSPALPR